MSDSASFSPPPVPAALPGFAFAPYRDPYEALTGPFFYKTDAQGEVVCGFVAAPKHFNGAGALHGGLLMSFADYAAFMIAQAALQDMSAVTLTAYCDFLRAGRKTGAPVLAKGEITRASRNFVFVRGDILCEDARLASFTMTLKKLPPRPSDG